MSKEQVSLPEYFQTPEHRWSIWLTYKCNFACHYCVMSHRDSPGGTPRWKPKEITGDQIISFFNNIEHPEGKPLGLVGGEPTLHKDFAKIVQNLEGYKITVTTNCGSKFFKDPNFTDQLKTKQNSILRMNTSFHPDFCTAETYLTNVYKMAKAGIWVEQTAFVYTPETLEKHHKALSIVDQGLRQIGYRGLYPDVYMGFWNEKDGFDATTTPTNLWPRGDHDVEEFRRAHLGISDWDQYREATAATEKYYIDHCKFANERMLVAPNGDVFACHYKLYHGIDPMYNILDFKMPEPDAVKCSHYGYCLTCNYPQHEVSPKREIVVNKLYDRNDLNIPEVKQLSLELQDLAGEKNTVYNEKNLFETTMVYLYSGHRHYGEVLYYGDPKNSMLSFLKDKRYKVNFGRLGLTTLKKRNKKADLVIFSNHNYNEHDTDFILEISEMIREGGHIAFTTNVTDQDNVDNKEYAVTMNNLHDTIIKPLLNKGFVIQGGTDYTSIPVGDPRSKPDNENHSFAFICLRNV